MNRVGLGEGEFRRVWVWVEWGQGWGFQVELRWLCWVGLNGVGVEWKRVE